ncbi:hypothetical protein Y1Q_0007837 [Alligator mississippiensis]|uniref:Uncharacterized protein n=1 Tax=Alligator mississippiensis TaxID=8496 RepID=A0A151N817_ALLMI|nr:hypothetical protein Y1Q_0007837 [Alligator mississippiensis]
MLEHQLLHLVMKRQLVGPTEKCSQLDEVVLLTTPLKVFPSEKRVYPGMKLFPEGANSVTTSPAVTKQSVRNSCYK